MPCITFIQPDGTPIKINEAQGTLMEIALEHGVEGIDGNCGGVCSCSTCHVRVPREWMDRVGPISFEEKELLSFESAADERSRLACQIELRETLNGLVVEVVRL